MAQPVGKYALLVGIGKYPIESKWPDLHSDADAKRLKAELLKQDYLENNIKLLLNEDATLEAIKLAFGELLSEKKNNLEAGDQIFIYLGGHSQKVMDISGDEEDGLDEAFVPYDAFPNFSSKGYLGDKHLLDDRLEFEISRIASKITSSGSLFFCYDGGISTNKKAKNLISKGIFPPLKIPLPSKKIENSNKIIKDNEWLDISYTNNLSQIVTLNPREDGQPTFEIPIKNSGFGSPLVFSYLNALQNKDQTIRYRALIPILERTFKQNNINLNFHLDGAQNTELWKRKLNINADIEDIDSANIFSITIGVSNYLNQDNLNFCHSDAELFSKILQKSYSKKLKPENQYIFLDSNTKIHPIISALQAISNKIKDNDIVYFYFAGHGDVETWLSRNGHLLLHNSPKELYMTGGTLQISFLKEIIEKYRSRKARVFMIVDACHSGKLAGGEEGQSLLVGNINEVNKESARFLSCNPKEKSVESLDFGGGHGAFTYFLAKGISEFALSKTTISVGEIKQYVIDSVSKRTNLKQHPIIEGNSKLTFLPRPSNETPIQQKTNSTNGDFANRNADFGDSLKNLMVKDLRIAINQKNFISLKEKSAKSLLEMISNKWPEDKLLVSTLGQEIENGISQSSQTLINQYINGDESIVQESYFKTSALDLDYLLELIGTESPLYNSYQARKYFFEGRSISPALVDNDQKRYLLDAAIENLKNSLSFVPEGAHNYNAIGRLYQANKQYKEAIFNYKKAIRLAPNWSFPINNMATSFVELASIKNIDILFDSSIRYFKRFLEINPKSAVAYYNLASTYRKVGQNRKAIQNFLLSNSLDKNFVEGYLSLGDIYRSAEKWDSAIYYLDQGLNIKKDRYDLLTALGNVYFDQIAASPNSKKPDLRKNARDKFTEAVKINSFCEEAYLGLGNLYFEMEKYDSAAIEYKKCLELDSNSVWYQNYYVEALTRSDQIKLAEKIALKLSKKAPVNAEVWLNLGILAAISNNFTFTEKYLKKAIQLGIEKAALEEEVLLTKFRKSPNYKTIILQFKQ